LGELKIFWAKVLSLKEKRLKGSERLGNDLRERGRGKER
jgi:hypothetical protein